MIGYAMNIGMQVMVARRKGEGNDAGIGEVVDHELRLVVLMGLIWFILLHFFSAFFLTHIIKSELVRSKAVYFLSYRSYGVFFALINSCLSFYWDWKHA
jgi:Na+-driven multidrug efflux pump